jgi:hypothetical protein
VATNGAGVQLVLPGMPSLDGRPGIDLTLSSPHEERRLRPGEFDAVYGEVTGASGPVFVWNRWGEDMLIVAVGDDYSYISMGYGQRWFELEETGSEDGEVQVEVMLGGEAHWMPKAVLAPRERGLEVLRRAGDFRRLLAVHTWRE